jgi:hypothetical protein
MRGTLARKHFKLAADSKAYEIATQACMINDIKVQRRHFVTRYATTPSMILVDTQNVEDEDTYAAHQLPRLLLQCLSRHQGIDTALDVIPRTTDLRPAT